jgi:hypothetical protein
MEAEHIRIQLDKDLIVQKKVIKHGWKVLRTATEAAYTKGYVFQSKKPFRNHIGNKFNNLLRELENNRLLPAVTGEAIPFLEEISK